MSDLATAVDRLADLVADEIRRRRAVEDAERHEHFVRNRRSPHRLRALQLAESLPGLIDLFDGRVPHEMIAKVADRNVEIPCACKEHTVLLERGSIGACDCGRFFIFDGVDVRVAKVDPALLADDDDG